MKRTLLIVTLAAVLAACTQTTPVQPRIAIAGIAIESSTFSPAVSLMHDFRIRETDSLLSDYPFLHPDSGVVDRAVWLPALKARAMPGGIVKREVYEELTARILEMLKASLPLDGFFFDIHGAMSVEGLSDPEGDLIGRIRKVIGPDVLVSSCMDLHGSVSHRLAKNVDMITCYRMAPHDDAMNSRRRAVVNLLERLESGKGKPAYKAWIKVPVLLPGEKTSTRVEPAKSLYALIPRLIDGEKVIDASIWMSYPWADEPRNHAVVMAYGDDKKAVAAAAGKLAEQFWSVRREFAFVAPTDYLDACLADALASEVKPYVISDMGDNPTAGGAGDVTWTLTELLKRPEFKHPDGKSLIYASIPDADFVSRAVATGVNGIIDAEAGARVDSRYAPPVRLNGRITAIYKDDRDGDVVVVKIGSISVIVTQKRKAYHYEHYFTQLGLHPRETDILVVKIGYLVPELYELQKGWMMALTPGGVDQDLMRIPYKNIIRPIFPLDADMEDPELKAEWM
ncbi:MAG: microcystin degradation protein MlrC [Paludibacter sp. 47-17]|nr:MAG: microcystin degradation protein MlrC [Paludibacter sp. SCN 50-10]OJX91534.1 MAG: microcystin degradation protein MlrC [Paludibacter sp. 47-17]